MYTITANLPKTMTIRRFLRSFHRAARQEARMSVFEPTATGWVREPCVTPLARG